MRNDPDLTLHHPQFLVSSIALTCSSVSKFNNSIELVVRIQGATRPLALVTVCNRIIDLSQSSISNVQGNRLSVGEVLSCCEKGKGEARAG